MANVTISGAKGGGSSFKQRADTLRSNDTFEGLLVLCGGPILGPVNGLKSQKINGTPIEDASGTANFKDVVMMTADGDPAKFPQIATLKLGAGASPISVNLSVGNTNPAGTPGPWVVKTLANTGADSIDLRFVVNQLVRQDKTGIYEATANLEIQMKPIGTTTWINPNIAVPAGSYSPNGVAYLGRGDSQLSMYLPEEYYTGDGNAWEPETNNGYVAITGKTTSPYVHELRIDVPNTGVYANKGWDVRVRLREVETLDADPNFEQRIIQWETIAAVYASDVGDHPDWRGVAWTQIYGKASDQFNGAPEVEGDFFTKIVSVPPSNVFNPLTRQYTGVTWDGSFSKSYTNDPAWVINDALSDAVFGLSNLAPGAYLNKWDALEVSKYCSQLVSDGDSGTHPRFSINLRVTEPQKADEFIQYLAGAVSGFAWDAGSGEWRMKLDKPEIPSDIFTLESVEGEFNYSHSDIDSRFNDITMSFLNEEMDFREDRVRVFDEDHIDKYGRKPTTLVAIGCTNRQEALRRATLRLRASINEFRMVNFVTNRRGRLLQPFDTVLIADGDLGYRLPSAVTAANPVDTTPTNNRTTGRVLSMNGTRNILTLRDSVRMEIGVNYIVHFAVPNPNYNPNPTTQPLNPSWSMPTITISRTLTNTSGQRGDVTTLYLDSALPAEIPEYANFALEAAGLPSIPKTFRILDVKTEEDGEHVSIVAVEVDTGKYAAADAAVASVFSYAAPDFTVPPPLAPVSGSLLSLVQIPGDAFARVNLVLNWQRPPSLYLNGFNIRYRVNDGPFIDAVVGLQDTSWELVDPAAGLYYFEITTRDRRGAFSVPLTGSIDVNATVVAALNALQNPNVLSIPEKPAVVQEYNAVIAEQAGITAQATDYAITTEKTNYTAAVTTLSTYLGTLSPQYDALDTATPIVRSILDSNFLDVYNARQALLNKITDVTKTQADDAMADANSALSQATTALTQSNSALTGAQGALTSAANAATSATQAATSLAAAETAKIVAEGSAATAAADKALAEAAKNAAVISATSASGSASSASGSAVTATDAASAAATSQSIAADHASTANTKANIATEQAVAATDAASTAATSQALSASYSASAKAAAQQAHPTTFENQGTFFAGDSGNLTGYNNLAFVNDVTYGPTARHAVLNGGYGVIAWKGRSANDVNKKWKVRALVRALSAEVGHMQLRLEYYAKPNAEGTPRIEYQGVDQYNIASTTPVWIEAVFDSAGFNHPYAGPALVLWGSSVTSGVVQEVLALEMIDVSSELAAAASASIAATQATTATSAGSTATTQANLSAEFAGKAKVAEAKTTGIDFSNLTTFISSSENILTPSSNDFVFGSGQYLANDATDGPVFRASGNNAQFVARKYFPVVAGNTYRISDRHRVVTASTSAYQPAFYLGFRLYGANGAAVGNYYADVAIYPGTTGFFTRSIDVTAAQILANIPTAVYASVLTIMNYRDEQPVLNSTSDLAYVRMADVTAELAAGVATSKATVATTQAATATAAASTASTQASLASTSATNASNSAGAASSSATAASGSATSASGSAATAATQAGLASTSAGNAASSATAASGSATSASGSASTAATQATLSSNFATVAQARSQVLGMTPNARFQNGMTGWVQNHAGATPLTQGAWNATFQSSDGVWVSNAGSASSNVYSELIPINPARKYKIRGRVYSSGHTGTMYVGATSHDGAGTAIGGNAGHNYIAGWANVTKAAGWHDIESQILTGEGTTTEISNWFRLGTKQVRVLAFLNYNSAATQVFGLDSLWIEDVTESDTAANSATIATTQATAATSSASAAATSATLSSTYAGNASTSASNALTSANNASGSATTATNQANIATTQATNASGSASSANTSATNAANSANAASGSASAAATSASNAATSSTAAGNSATSAQNSATSASTSAGSASTSASNASTSASQASTSASNASGSASSAGTSATNAANSAGAASGSASAAATSASNASTSSTAAGNSATAANSAKVAAEAANATAQSAASAASTSSANASASASSASTSSTQSATYRDTALQYASAAKVAASETYPSDFSQDGRFFTQFYGTEASADNIEVTYPSIAYVDTANGRVARYGSNFAQGSYPHTNIRKRVPIAPNIGRWFRLTAKARLHTSPGVPVYFVSAIYGLVQGRGGLTYGGFNIEGGATPGFNSAAYLPADGSILTVSQEIKLSTPFADTDGNVPAYLHPGMYFVADGGGAIGQCDLIQLKFEDITEQKIATSQASIASTSAATASASAASATSSAILSANIGTGALNKNPAFALWPDGQDRPTDWLSWVYGTGTITRATGALGGYATRMTNPAGNDNLGMSCVPYGMVGRTSGWFVIEADVTLESGTLVGAGCYISKSGWDQYMGFSGLIDPQTGLAYGNGSVGRRYAFKKLVNFAEAGGTSNYTLYAMTNWGGFTAGVQKTLLWHNCSIRESTLAEVRDQSVLAPLQATVSSQSSAITDLQGKTAARWVTSSVAGNNRAQLSIYADANTGAGVDIIGDVSISGNLLVGGSVNTGKLGANAATNGSHQYIADAVAMSTNWQDAATVTVNMIGGAAKIDFACYIAGMGINGGGTIQFRLLRNGSEIRIGTLCLLPGEQTIYGGYIGDNPQSVYQPIAGMFPFFVLDTSGTTGDVIYKAQIRSPYGNFQYCDFAERQLSVTEFRR